MAAYWATPAASWLGTRAPLRSPVHRGEAPAQPTGEVTADSGIEAEAP